MWIYDSNQQNNDIYEENLVKPKIVRHLRSNFRFLSYPWSHGSDSKKYFVISGWYMSAQAIVPIAAVARWAAQGAAGATVVPPLQAL